MTQQETSVPLVNKVLRNSFRLIKGNLNYLSPFLILAIIELIALIFLYLAPRVPLRAVLGPPIKTFWGERFLHYPYNFILLPKLVSHSRTVLSIIFGSLLSGMAVSIILDVYNKKQIELLKSFRVAINKYLPIFGIFLIMNIGFFLVRKGVNGSLLRYFYAGHAKLLFLGPKIWLGAFLITFNFILAAFVQALFVYTIPAIIIDNKGFFRSIGTSLKMFLKFFFTTIILVILPMLLFIPVIVLGLNNAFLINRLFPEIVFYVEALGIIMSTIIIDPIITMSTALLYLMKREGQ